MHIILDGVPVDADQPFDVDRVRHMITVSREVLHRNRNTTWDRPIGLVTDNLGTAHAFLDPADHHTLTNHAAESKFVGFCWMTAERVIWIRPRRELRQTVSTLAHETAHALTLTTHGLTWRRAYALILPLWLAAFTDPDPWAQGVVEILIRETVHHYSRKRRRFDRVQEIGRHVEAAERAWHKHKSLI